MSKIRLFFVLVSMQFFVNNLYSLDFNIYYTNTLKEEDFVYFENLYNELNIKKIAARLFIIDVYTNYKFEYTNTFNSSYVRNGENSKFMNQEEFNHYCENEFLGSNSYVKFISSDELPNLQNYFPETSIVKKKLKSFSKKKSDVKLVKLLYYNGFKECKFSRERLKNRLSLANQIKDYSSLKVGFTGEKQGKTLVLRPDEKSYSIEFDSIGVFDEYELEIKCLTKSSEGVWDKFKLEFTDFENQSPVVLYYRGELKSCVIRISEEVLADLCYKFSEKIGTDEIPDQEDCGSCKLECLYHKKFSISIKGISGGLTDVKLKSIVEPVFFQCVKQ